MINVGNKITNIEKKVLMIIFRVIKIHVTNY